MSEQRPRRQTATLATVLRDVLDRAAWTAYADRVALYVVHLTDFHGFALALRIHARLPGPDPAVLRARAQEAGIRKPHMAGSAPLEMLASTLEALDPDGPDGALCAWTMRALFERGAVPVLLMDEGSAVVTTLEEIATPEKPTTAEPWGSGWTRPITGEA